MVKILHINSTISGNSGVMSVIMNYYNHINRNKIQFDFLYYLPIKDNFLSYQTQIERMGGMVYFISDFQKIAEFNRKLDELLKKNSCYDIVQIHDAFICRFIYKTLKKNGVKCVIVHSHATRWSDKKMSAIRNYLLCRNLDNFYDEKFACSQAAGKFLFGSPKAFFIMRNAIDSDKYKYNEEKRKELRKEFKFGNNMLVFGHVGNFNNQKNHKFLIKIFKEIISIRSDSCLLLIGDGPLRNDIEALIRNEGLQAKIILLGKRNDVQDLYQAMDCFILPSLYEGLPMAGVEAQCSGLPIIMSDVITEETGIYKYKFLSLKSEPRIWAEAALGMVNDCNNDKRIEARKRIVECGFDISNEANKVEMKYYSLI